MHGLCNYSMRVSADFWPVLPLGFVIVASGRHQIAFCLFVDNGVVDSFRFEQPAVEESQKSGRDLLLCEVFCAITAKNK